VSSLLADENVPQRERIRRAGIPSRTYERIRRRAYDEAWVYDTYVPNLSRLGRPILQSRLVHPFLEHYHKIESTWVSDPDCILLWKWSESLFGLFARPRCQDETQEELPSAKLGNSRGVRVDVSSGGSPIFFDFAGVWAQLGGLPAASTYPRGAPSRIVLTPENASGERTGQRALLDLYRRFSGASATSRAIRGGPVRFSRAERRLLRSGIVTRRVLLNLGRVPSLQHRVAENVAFVQGSLLPGVRAGMLFNQLARARVRPFLFLHDEKTVFIATLTSPPRPPPPGQERPAILATLESNLREVEIVRQPLSTLSVEIDHRYDRLLERT
jgi:hypothetical protein